MFSIRNISTIFTGAMMFKTCYEAPNNLGFFKAFVAASSTATIVYLAVTPLQIYCDYAAIMIRNDSDEMKEKRAEIREIENTFLRDMCTYLYDHAYGVHHFPERYAPTLPTWAEINRDRERTRSDHERVRESMRYDDERRERMRQYRY